MEEAIHLEGVLRFVAVFLMTIVGPALLLAYFGVASIQVEEQSVTAEVNAEAAGTADAWWNQVDRRFSGFEDRVRDRLEAGRSPLEARGELDGHLLVAMRFDEGGRLLGPFAVDESGVGLDIEGLFDPSWIAATAAERQRQDPLVVARLYGVVSRESGLPSVAGRAALDRARMLIVAGKDREAMLLLDEVQDRYASVRDPWGIRLGDLARLEKGELQLNRAPADGALTLRSLVEDLLAAPWTVGQGGEGAVALRALSLLEPSAERDWALGARGRVSERYATLYWAGELLPEHQRVVGGPGRLRMTQGDIHWRLGERALWATTWWDGSFYAFALDLDAIVGELKADARGTVRLDAPVAAFLRSAGEAMPVGALVTKDLGPWLPSWSLIVVARDPEALSLAQANRRRQRIAVIVLAITMIALGAILTTRLIKRELDVARMKTDFAANVSHELRSPITQIRLKGESLLLGLSENPEEREEAYQAIVRESERLSRLVDNVLDFSAIERGAKRYTLRPGDLVDTVYRALDSVSSAQEVVDKELDVELPDDLPEVAHDSDAVAQCVINLVSNAAKYSAPDAWIGIRGRVVEDGVEITVSDRGIGIAPHDLRNIFEPFFRSRDALARRRKGTGIGLTITRYIMRAHGGEVFAQSQPGKGSTFTLRFPREAPPNADAGDPL